MSCSAFLSLRAACTCVCTWGAVDFIKPCSPLSAPCFRCRSRTLPRRLFLCLSRPGLATSGLSSFALTLGTTTPQSPTMSIGLLRLEIMHISRIRQLWLVWQLCRYHSPVPNVWPSRRRQIQLLQLWRCMGGHVRRGRPVHAPRWVPSMQRESRRGKRTRRVQAPAAVHRRRLLCCRRLHNQPS